LSNEKSDFMPYVEYFGLTGRRNLEPVKKAAEDLAYNGGNFTSVEDGDDTFIQVTRNQVTYTARFVDGGAALSGPCKNKDLEDLRKAIKNSGYKSFDKTNRHQYSGESRC